MNDKPRRRVVEPLGNRTAKKTTDAFGEPRVVANPTVDSLLTLRKRRQQKKVVIRLKR